MGPFSWPVSKVLHTITDLKNWFGCGVGLILSFSRNTNVSTFQIHDRIQTTEHLTLDFLTNSSVVQVAQKETLPHFPAYQTILWIKASTKAQAFDGN
ncbi:hypothetical protein PanWU01x14_108070 [Parasponia andersonii]|uniref:Uncharacterized protein n=1 Tax=Parasponia andersonii TaxID=3476 RepID=A0A2P5D0E8_PARAD|nr:hypothetical protein PanWU01x14_108070 [Parasponia andersonii]